MGATVARYTYDAWGKVLTVKDASGNNITSTAHIANINPFRYRSYYYDTETSLYYLQSRYYNSEVGRFINADELDFQTKIKVAEDNLFTYCINNPVNLNDVSGRWFLNYVAFGFQIELSFGIASFGLEFIITVDLKHIYAYAYGAFSFNKMGSNNLNAIIKDILPNILKKPQSIGKLFKGIAFSVCVFCVWRKWKNKFDPEAYTKGFIGAYATVATPFPLISVKGYAASSSSYFVIGAGASTGGMNVGAVPSYYLDVTPQFNFVMSKIMSMSSKIKRLAQNVD